jgi:hypothetical protein
MAILAMNGHTCGMGILAMILHGRDAHATLLIPTSCQYGRWEKIQNPINIESQHPTTAHP